MAGPLFASAATLFSARLLLLFFLHLLPGGVDPVRDPVSDYAVADEKRTRVLATLASWTAATAWICLGLALLLYSAHGAAEQGVGFWLLVLGLLLAVMPLVPTDRNGSKTTLRGRVHLLLAVAWFTLGYSTIGPMGRFAGDSAGQMLGVLDVVAGVSLAALVISLVLPPLRSRSFGIAERVFILVVTLAPLMASVDLTIRWLTRP